MIVREFLLGMLVLLLASCAVPHRSRPPETPALDAGSPESKPSASTFWIDPLQFSDGSAPEKAASSWKSLRRRQDICPGDTVVFRPGKYSRPMFIEVSGTELRPITFRSQDPLAARFLDRIKLRGSHLQLEGFSITSPEGYGVYVHGVGNVVSNCRIESVKNSGFYVNGDNARIIGCEVDRPGANGLAVDDCVEVLIEGNFIHDVGRSGIFVYDDAHNVTIRGNRIHRSKKPLPGKNPDGHGIYAKGTSTGKILIEDNDFIGSYFHQCISLRGPGIIRRNVVRGAGNTRNGIYLLDDTDKNPGAHVIVENNLVFDQGMGALRVGKSCENWTIEIRNNTLVGRTVGVLLGGTERTTVSLVNNIIGVTGPMRECGRPECHPKGYVVRHFGHFETLYFSNNLFFNRHARDTWSNLENLGENALFGDPGFAGDASEALHFRVSSASEGAKLVVDRGKTLKAVSDDLQKNPRVERYDIGAFEH